MELKKPTTFEEQAELLEKYAPTRRLFAQLYMLKLMYPDKGKWDNDFVKPLGKLIKKYKKDISLKHLDFPYHWQSMLKQE